MRLHRSDVVLNNLEVYYGGPKCDTSLGVDLGLLYGASHNAEAYGAYAGAAVV